jgi:hypothetical protein
MTQLIIVAVAVVLIAGIGWLIRDELRRDNTRVDHERAAALHPDYQKIALEHRPIHEPGWGGAACAQCGEDWPCPPSRMGAYAAVKAQREADEARWLDAHKEWLT